MRRWRRRRVYLPFSAAERTDNENAPAAKQAVEGRVVGADKPSMVRAVGRLEEGDVAAARTWSIASGVGVADADVAAVDMVLTEARGEGEAGDVSALQAVEALVQALDTAAVRADVVPRASQAALLDVLETVDVHLCRKSVQGQTRLSLPMHLSRGGAPDTALLLPLAVRRLEAIGHLQLRTVDGGRAGLRVGALLEDGVGDVVRYGAPQLIAGPADHRGGVAMQARQRLAEVAGKR